jgi:Domain of unknown function (DUF3470)
VLLGDRRRLLRAIAELAAAGPQIRACARAPSRPTGRSRAASGEGDVRGPGRFDGALRRYGPGGPARGHFSLSGIENWQSLNAKYAKIWPNITIQKTSHPIPRSGRGSRINCNTSYQVQVRVIEATVPVLGSSWRRASTSRSFSPTPLALRDCIALSTGATRFCRFRLSVSCGAPAVRRQSRTCRAAPW